MAKLGKKATAAAKALERAEADNHKFEKLEEAEAALQGLISQAETIKRDKATMDAAKRADRLEDVAESLADRRDTAEQAEQAVTEAEAARKAEAAVLEAASEEMKQAEGLAPERKALGEKLTEMRRVRPILEKLAGAGEARAIAEQAHAEAAEQLAADEESARELEETIEQTEAAITASQEKLGERGVLTAAVEKTEKALADRRALNDKLDEEKALKADKTAAEKDVEGARATLAKAKAALDKLVKAREAASAAMLAKELQSGEPCPVCGSKKHPAPAKSLRKVPGEEEIAAAQAAVEEAEEALEQARDALEEANGGLAALGGETKALKKALGKAATAKLVELQRAQATAAAGLIQHDRAKGQLERNLENLKEDKQSLKALRPQIEKQRKDVSALAKKLAMAAATLKARQEQVPDAWRDLVELDRATAKVETDLATNEARLKAAIAAEKQAQLEATRCASELKSATRQRNTAAKTLEKALADWEKRLSDAGFPTERDYRDALLPDVEMDHIQMRIERHAHDLVAAQTTAKDAKSAVAGLKRLDVEALRTSAEQAEMERGQAADDRAHLAGRVDELRRAHDSVEEVGSKLSKVEKRYGVMGRIANVANGDNKHRISLQRFVLAARLDDVLACASKRLSIMSRKRYLLRRNTSADDRRSAGGLELEIEDAYTAKSRPVSTLSGGESFQAALSLALGLSEVVQAYAGGIRLDTIFVDEGFGSLDPEALDLAINTLIDLQQTGRMVGVISHVPELSERIDVRLEVSAGKSGSKAAFRLP